jgi:hypothetical protein
MGAGHADQNRLFFKESHLGISSSTTRKEWCDVSMVYMTKFTFEGVVECHKYCMFAKGFSQQEGIDYTKPFSLVANINYV